MADNLLYVCQRPALTPFFPTRSLRSEPFGHTVRVEPDAGSDVEAGNAFRLGLLENRDTRDA